MKIINIECPICESKKTASINGYEKDYLVRCSQCSFVYSNLKPTKDELDNTYGLYEYSNSVPTEVTIEKIKKLVAFLMNQIHIKNVLDIACGNGIILCQFKKLGYNTYGTEYDSRLEEIGEKKGFTMLPGGVLPSKPDGKTSFDLIIFTEIIEHINNPKEVINNIYNLLSSNGILYITTPNFDSLERKLLGNGWGMICYPEHISYYSPKTLHKLLTKSGFKKIHLYTENISIFRIVEYMRNSKNEKNVHLNPEAISAKAQKLVSENIFAKAIKNLLNKLLNITKSGTSIVAVYRKIN